ncbi:predicted protein [Nematostella vectensis]|uniref:RRM domain-containing protein n=1 Tax=Nematostella vectensis TaxID=45351 RepID=A7RUG7_NEMVE|nr:ribosomal RNA-processing protein 7 homolog A [Nematostella vectensis]EDO44850.1 predicted protein [Nematostella vectensis]|eukprot:XP_001636913.1 predicted protein [Nematostella vectensis]
MATEFGFRLLRVKFNESCKSNHFLYFKKHSVREEESLRPSDKTLFVINVPPYCTKLAIKKLFGKCGGVKSVYLHKQPGKVKETKTSLLNTDNEVKGFKVAYVVFKKPSSLDAALKLDPMEVLLLSDEDNPVLTGVKKWSHEYSLRYPDPLTLQEEIDTFMREFDKKEEQAKEAEKMERGQPDEEGWITVGKGGRKPGATKVDAAEIQEKRKKKKKALVNFYQFQQRETKREHIAQLRKKFEEDKKKIAEMKAARRFRPY